MHRNDEKMLKAYFREIRGLLPCGFGEKNRIMDKLRAGVEEYLENQPEADHAQIRSHFGEPMAIADAFLQEMESGALLKTLNFRRKVVSIVAGSMLSLMLMWGAGVTVCVYDSYNSSHATIQEDLIIIEEQEMDTI